MRSTLNFSAEPPHHFNAVLVVRGFCSSNRGRGRHWIGVSDFVVLSCGPVADLGIFLLLKFPPFIDPQKSIPEVNFLVAKEALYVLQDRGSGIKLPNDK